MNSPSADTPLFSEFFGGPDGVEVEMSRHRFVFAGVPSERARWERCKAEYRRIKNAYAEEDAANGLPSSSDSGAKP